MLITFNRKFYNSKAIKNAIKAYQELADFKVEGNKKTIKVIVRNIDREIKEIIKDEFCNYVLAEMKHGKKT